MASRPDEWALHVIASGASIADELNKHGQLRQSDAITEDEHQRQKANVLA